jgi:flagellar M-ring protein FliF
MNEIALLPASGVTPGDVAQTGKKTALALPEPVLSFLRLTGNPVVRRAAPTILLSILIVIAAFSYLLSGRNTMRPLFPELAETDVSVVMQALDASGLPYQIDRQTGALTVPADEYHKIKLALAAQGLPKAAPAGYDLLSTMPLGVSRALEQARLKQSQETELARSIAEIAVVREARVHLALPETSAFLRNSKGPGASVFVKLATGRVLSQEQVQSIVNLVASSVPELKPDHVSVIDQSGRLLTSGSADDGLIQSQKQLDYQRKVEAMYRERLSALLIPIAGDGNFTAEVHATINYDEQQNTKELFDRNNAVLRSERADDSTDGQSVPAGIPGVLSNISPVTATVGEPGSGTQTSAQRTESRRSESFTRNYEIGKEVSVSRSAIGKIERVSVAIVLRADKRIKTANIAAIEQLVRNAVGFDEARGDKMSVSVQPFAAVPPMPAPAWYANEDVQKYVPIIVAAVLVMLISLLVIRPQLKKMSELAAVRTEHVEQDRAETAYGESSAATRQTYDEKLAFIKQFVVQNHEQASTVLHRLLTSAEQKV